MPTQYKRVSVTLTPPLQEARERLRRRGLRPSVGDLALAGAEALLVDADARAQRERRQALLRERLAARVRSGASDIEADALAEVREHGWTRA